MLDESKARKPSFSEEDSSPVVMADGQTWHFRRPVLRLRPKFSGGRSSGSRVVPYLEGGSELGTLLDAVTGSGEFVDAAMNVGAYLLSFNYDLADEDLESIFGFDAGAGADPMAWVKPIIQIANGIEVPKAPTSDTAVASS